MDRHVFRCAGGNRLALEAGQLSDRELHAGRNLAGRAQINLWNLVGVHRTGVLDCHLHIEPAVVFVERPGPAALECAIDVWGRSGPVQPVAPLPLSAPPIDEDALKAAAKPMGAAKRPLIVAGGGALDAAVEVTQLAHLLQAPVFSYRRGRGVKVPPPVA